MAQFQKGKGTRKRSVTLKQIGALLTKDEIDGASEMLTGYWQHSTEESARAELLREAMDLITAGLVPVDEAAQEIAALVPTKTKSKKSELPVREDIYVYNEATGLVVTSKRMAGKFLEEGSKQWNKAIEKGDILPMMLFQDDPFTVRVVVGDELDQAENDEWVARIDWHLNIKDGKLCITGGAPLFSEDFEADDSYFDQFIREVKIPKGHYKVSVYSYIPGVNGKAVLDHLAGGYDKSEPFGAWFRRTRKNSDFPLWLRDWCAGDPSADPGHEGDWENVKSLDEADWPDYVHFLIHLMPISEIPKKGLSEIPKEGWFDETVNARVPERCPLGIVGRDVSGHLIESHGGWIFARNPFAEVANSNTTSVQGGPVSLPINELALPFQIGWFCS
ncbi:MAG: hypothetical protein KDD53_11035, partial [Bdellovibrionales bacterium]|nr:hypothetical protein [Bdellovibrionales bacterium]